MFRLININYLGTTIVLPLIVLLFWGKNLISTPDTGIFTALSMPFSNYLSELIDVGRPSVAAVFTGGLVMVLLAVLLMLINLNYRIINMRTAVPSVFFVIIASAFVGFQSLTPTLLGGFFVALAFSRMLDFFQHDNVISQAFEAAFYLSVGSLFYLPALSYLLVLWYGLLVIRPFVWREWVAPFFGVLMPYFILFAFQFGIWGDAPDFTVDFRLPFDNFMAIFRNAGVYTYLLCLLLFVFVIFALFFSARVFTSIKLRKYYHLTTACSLFSLLIIPLTGPAQLVLAAIPLSFLLAAYFGRLKSSFWREVLFLLLVVLALLNVYM